MKTADLEGARLDYWVAKAQGHKVSFADFLREPDVMRALPIDTPRSNLYRPSTRWELGGPIIEAEAIAVFVDQFAYDVNPNRWLAGYELRAENGQEYGTLTGQGEASLELECSGGGPTPLIAAMRAFVASKFGDEIAETPP